MGHKTHPLGFRLGITQEHHSAWYTKLNNYSNLIQEDFRIRNTVNQFLKKMKKNERKNKISLGQIFIQRNKIIGKSKKNIKNEIKLNIYSLNPSQITGEKGEKLNELKESFKKNLSEKIINTSVIGIKNPYTQATFIADRFVEELEARIPFRRSLANIIETVVKANDEDEEIEEIGIKLQVSGRLNGAEIARTEWRREGRVPLQTLRAKIDYSSKTAFTVYGSLGVKIWLFKGEEIPVH